MLKYEMNRHNQPHQHNLKWNPSFMSPMIVVVSVCMCIHALHHFWEFSSIDWIEIPNYWKLFRFIHTENCMKTIFMWLYECVYVSKSHWFNASLFLNSLNLIWIIRRRVKRQKENGKEEKGKKRQREWAKVLN